MDRYPDLIQSESNIKKFDLPKTAVKLGSGKQGTAYDIGKGRVLKLTKDKGEAEVSAWVCKNPVAGVWRIYNVFYSSRLGLYGIIGEKLSENTQKSKAVLNTLVSAVYAAVNTDEPQTTIPYTNKNIDRILDAVWDEDVSQVIIKAAEELALGMNGLRASGIKWYDLHDGNVMWKGQSPKIIDLGHSVGRVGKVDIAEST